MEKQHIVEFIIIVLSILAVVFKDRIADGSIQFQNKNFGSKYDEKDHKAITNTIILISSIVIIAALISMLKLTSFRV